MRLLFILLIAGLCYAEKTITLNKVSNVNARFVFQTDNSETGSALRFYPLRVDYFCIAQSSDNIKEEKVFESQFYGTPRTTPYTLKECYAFIRGVNNMNIVLSDRLKTLALNAINEDLSV